jgi:outer membrane putative beta-barrel porin/alpha-amylase
MDLSSDTIVGFASFGVTNNFDVGIAVPWVRIALDADLGLFSASGIDLTPGGHLLVVPRTSASGVGDVAVFGKYHVWHRKEGGLAAEIQLRLPSGDTNSLRGTGVTRTLVSAIWSQGGDVSPHANVGYEFWSAPVLISSGGDVFAKNQVNYAFGVEFQAHPRATATVDVIGRRQLHGGQIGYQTVAIGPGSIDLLVALPEGLNVVSLAPGIKWNVAGNVLVTGNLLTSLINNGLKAKLIPVVGFDWAF